MFYLLLLALAEHIGFGPAYLASAVASTALITSYSAAVLALAAPRRADRRLARRRCTVISTSRYRAEDYALLFGALGLFTVLAAFMYLTRRIDWFDRELRRQEPRAGRACSCTRDVCRGQTPIGV